MSQIIGGHTFVPLEKNIDDVKLNAITSGAVITSELISTQTLSTSAVTGDQFLILKAGGTLARILYDDLATSLGSSSGMVGAITSVRLRSFNAVGNPSFEVDQINVGNTVAGANAKIIDRWSVTKAGTLAVSAGSLGLTAPDIVVPGTSFRISRSALRITLTTAEASLGASDYLFVSQQVEGPFWRELQNDVHSTLLLVRSSVGNLSFGLNLRDSAPATKTLTKLCTLAAANSWTLISLANLPVWPSGNFTTSVGSVGYQFGIVLAAGTTFMNSANDTWQSNNTLAAVGQSNFAASPINSTFDVAFIQHEPGPLCTTLIDKPFNQNLDECLRYYQKSWDYATAVGAVSANGQIYYTWPAGSQPIVPVRFPKRMAKVPTLLLYSPATGTSNNVRDNTANVDKGITTNRDASESGFNGTNVGSPNASAWQGSFHFTADTGW